MKIGIDFDNTIICYDEVFNTVGIEKGLIPDSLPIGKSFVRDHLRQIGREVDWTWLQGYVYGTRLADAKLYDGVNDFLSFCTSKDIECCIISHKTKYPYSGEKYNLHTAALEWIKHEKLGIEVFFEITKENKVKRISDLGCSCFIDDLPEFLSLPGFLNPMVKILFDPLNKYIKFDSVFNRVISWREILSMVKSNTFRVFYDE